MYDKHALFSPIRDACLLRRGYLYIDCIAWSGASETRQAVRLVDSLGQAIKCVLGCNRVRCCPYADVYLVLLSAARQIDIAEYVVTST